MKLNLNLTLKDYIIIALGLLLLGVILALGIVANKYKLSNNQVALLSEEIYTYKNKYNEEYLAKQTYVLKAEQLEKYNKELNDEYQSLKDHPVVITKTNVLIKIDTIRTNIYEQHFNNGNLVWKWNAKDSTYYTVSGESGVTIDSTYKKSYTNIDSISINGNITMDVIDDGEQLSVIAKTDNPYINISDIKSVVIDPSTSETLKKYFKLKRWGIGPSISGGIIFGSDFKGNAIVGAGGCIGLSIHYDIFQW